MQISIIIVNFNTSALLLQCIESIFKSVQGVGYEIIVADNGSNEEQKSLLRNSLSPLTPHPSPLTVIELPQNLGFGKANNAAAEVAKGEYLFLLNPDTILLNDAVSILYNYMEKHQHVGICGGNLFDCEMKPTHSFHRIFPGFLSELDFATGKVYRRVRYGKNSQFNHTSQALPVAMITGADLMIRRSVWDKLHGFDPVFFMYFEDSDLCKRCSECKYDIMSVPSAHIQHLEGKSFTESESHCKRILDGRFKYFYKHHSISYNRLTNLMNIYSLAMATILFRCIGKESASRNYSQRLRIYKELCSKAHP